MVDFYVLLLAYHQERKNNCALMVISELMMIVKGCGMGKFASALMFVLISMFDIDKHLLLCTPSKKHGTFLLDEMMKAGNFGQYDTRHGWLNLSPRPLHPLKEISLVYYPYYRILGANIHIIFEICKEILKNVV